MSGTELLPIVLKYQAPMRLVLIEKGRTAQTARKQGWQARSRQSRPLELVADPDSEENRHQIIVDADSSCFEINLSGRPAVENPKTSVLSALSVARAMANFESALIL